MVESIVGCKWSLHVLARIRQGIHRPGALRRSTRGLTTKVLNERLNKFLRFGIVERRVFAQVPPRVEYHFTAFGRKFIRLLDEIEKLQRDVRRG
jgi:DNA-binding HxlR family transcriptional regulator